MIVYCNFIVESDYERILR